MKLRRLGLMILSIALAVSACAPKAEGLQIRVDDVWGRPSPKAASAGAFYMTIHNDGGEADKLFSVMSTACGMAELHESYMLDNGAMGMRPVQGGSIEIPAGGSVELKVGGLHIMCMDKQVDFAAGDKYAITLNFEKAGEIMVEAEIKDE